MNGSRWLTALLVAFVVAAATAQSAQARGIVGFSGNYSAGTVVVRTNERSLYYVLGGGKAIRYPVGVGRAGNGAAPPSSTARICGRRGRRRPSSGAINRTCRRLSPVARRTTRWVRRCCSWPAGNAPSTARIIRDRSVGLCPNGCIRMFNPGVFVAIVLSVDLFD